MSSSPSLPSPSRLFSKKLASFVGDSHAIPVPVDAIAGFTSASKLLLQVHASGHEDDPIEPREELGERTNIQDWEGKPVKPKKLPVEKGKAIIKIVKKARASKKTLTESNKTAAAVKEQPEVFNEAENPEIQDSDKKRVRKSKGEAQTKIGKGKITKPGALNIKKTKSVVSAKKLKNTDQPVAQALTKKNEDIYPLGEEPLDLGLIEAIKRRKVWTPVKDTSQRTSRLEDGGTTPRAGLAPEDCESEQLALSGFDNLLGDYGYARDDDRPFIGLEKTRDTDGQASTKRRKIELVNLAVYPSVPVAQSKKPKLPKKKPQTITEKATAPFLSEESAAPSLLQYFETLVTEPIEDHQSETQLSTVSKARPVSQKPKPKATGKPTRSKSKKNVENPPVLLSPMTAMKSTTDQELIFGTSSQLVRDESPTFIKDLQQAMEASELMEEQSGRISTKEASASSRLGFYGVAAVTPYKSSRNLWSVAARDSEGSLLDTEVIDLVDTPKTSKPVPVGKPIISQSDNQSLGLDTMEQGLKNVEELPVPRLGRNTAAHKPLMEQNDVIELPIPRSLAEASLRDRRKSRSPVKMQKTRKESDISAQELGPGRIPNYQGFTTIELSKEIAKYGFKAIKKRTDMIALLERCWESQSRIAVQALPQSTNHDEPLPKANAEIPEQASPKKKGRPRKASTAAPAANKATDDLSSKKSRGRPRKERKKTSSSEKGGPISQPPLAAGSIPPQVHASNPSVDIIKPSASSVSIGPVSSPTFPGTSASPTTLMSSITRAITTFPPTHSGTSPTFNEKILLYEPIVIEELTAWLNTEGLGRVGVDEEVSGALVKEWCEQRSVCCFLLAEGRRTKRGLNG